MQNRLHGGGRGGLQITICGHRSWRKYIFAPRGVVAKNKLHPQGIPTTRLWPGGAVPCRTAAMGGWESKLLFEATRVGANTYLHLGAWLQRLLYTHRGSQPHVCGQEGWFRAEPPPWGGWESLQLGGREGGRVA